MRAARLTTALSADLIDLVLAPNETDEIYELLVEADDV